MTRHAYAPDDERLRQLLGSWRTIAVVGLSSDPWRPAFGVARYLLDAGYDVIPVHPSETEVLGRTGVPETRRQERPVDCVDVFRRPEFRRSTPARP